MARLFGILGAAASIVMASFLGGSLTLTAQRGAKAAVVRSSLAASNVPQIRMQARLQSVEDRPISFEVNRGQVDRRVRFLSRTTGSTVFLTSHGIELTRSVPDGPGRSTGFQARHKAIPLVGHGGEIVVRQNQVRLRFRGANPRPQIVGLDPLRGVVNYLIGGDPHRWQVHVPTYARIQYRNIYPGVNLVLYGSQGHLEYDWTLAPGADLGSIVLAVEGATALAIDKHGNLWIRTPEGEVEQSRPISYQQVGRARRLIRTDYLLLGGHQVSFRVGRYDPSNPLIIDPVLSYSTYLGGNNFNFAFDIAADSAGNAYVAGKTQATNFPTVNPLQASNAGQINAYVAKFSPSGSLLYSTYLGGAAQDWAQGIAVDSVGNAYVTGRTESSNFPVSTGHLPYGGGRDAFVAKLSPTGMLVYSTYLGGSAIDEGDGITVDSGGNAYVTGYTTSRNFPTQNPLQSTGDTFQGGGFVTKLSPTGSLVYSTYLGKGTTLGRGIAVDGAGSAYVTGYTSSVSFPTANAFQLTLRGDWDAFVTKLSPDGRSLVYSTYLGGDAGPYGGNSYGERVRVDGAGNAYVAGVTFSTNFPTANALQASPGYAFVVKLSPDGRSLLYSTYFGGTQGGLFAATSLAIDAAGDVYLTGQTGDSGLPIKDAFQQSFGGGNSDAYVTKISPDGRSLIYSSYLGGSSDDYGTGIAADGVGNAYVTGETGSHFPLLNAAQPKNAAMGFDNTFVAKISASAPPPPPVKCKKGYTLQRGKCVKKKPVKCKKGYKLVHGKCKKRAGRRPFSRRLPAVRLDSMESTIPRRRTLLMAPSASGFMQRR